MEINWPIAAVIIVGILTFGAALTLIDKNEDPVARRIHACNSMCGLKNVESFDAEKSVCICEKE